MDAGLVLRKRDLLLEHMRFYQTKRRGRITTYDLYGDEKGNPGFGAGSPGDQSGYSYFTSGGQGQTQLSFRPDAWQNMGGQEDSKSFSFSFGGSGAQNSFGFGLNDMFSIFFGGRFGGFGGSAKSRSSFQSGSRSSSKSIKAIKSQVFRKEIADQGILL